MRFVFCNLASMQLFILTEHQRAQLGEHGRDQMGYFMYAIKGNADLTFALRNGPLLTQSGHT
jgi:hypothetical protein